jgi:hypothetical protein
MLQICLYRRHTFSTYDITAAFLNPLLPPDRDIITFFTPEVTKAFIQVYPEYTSAVDPNGKIYFSLLKAMYGLTDAGLHFFNFMVTHLLQAGYVQSVADPCVFYLGERSMIGLYVDDFIIMEDEKESPSRGFLKALEAETGPLKRKTGNKIVFLGLEIISTGSSFLINQFAQIEKLNEEFHPGHAKTPYLTPPDENKFPPVTTISKDPPIPFVAPKGESTRFKSKLMKYAYLSITRPEIRHAISLLAQVTQPTELDFIQLDQIASYINSTKDLSFTITSSPSILLDACIDASWGQNNDGTSHSGICLKIGNNVIHSASKKQLQVAKSSCEAELIALDVGCEDVVWTRGLLKELGYQQTTPTTVFQDNSSAMMLAIKGILTPRTKYYKIRYFWLKDLIHNSEVQLVKMDTEDMIADGFTKVLPLGKFITWRNKIINNQ